VRAQSLQQSGFAHGLGSDNNQLVKGWFSLSFRTLSQVRPPVIWDIRTARLESEAKHLGDERERGVEWIYSSRSRDLLG
jgi:hypothetical protein